QSPLKNVETTAKSLWSLLDESRQRREQNSYFALGNYSSLDLIIPGKIGVTVGLNNSADKSWEFEYLSGSFGVPLFIADLGKISDKRMSLIKRSFFGSNSFNVSYGVTYFSFDADLGDKFVNSINGNYPSAKVVGLKSWGFNLGIGNRWTIREDITIGVDWISWSQPVFASERQDDFVNYSTNPEYKDDVDTALKVLSYLPRLAILKLQFGMMF
ncbi:MAG: hypothetical protein HUU57_06550, partial [Bdellovibrio sp.]|nr:hypothetical protein [Bdellovibrio sp.]